MSTRRWVPHRYPLVQEETLHTNEDWKKRLVWTYNSDQVKPKKTLSQNAKTVGQACLHEFLYIAISKQDFAFVVPPAEDVSFDIV